MMNIIDNFLNKITMYRLILYYLMLLLGAAGIYGYLGILPFGLPSIAASVVILVAVCWITNTVFSRTFHAPTNTESVYISALILALIISPISSLAQIPLLLWAGILSMASKYLLAINQKHLFNPVAIAVVLTTIGFNGSASWWVGTLPMLPFVLLGFLIIKKVQKINLVLYFFVASLLTILSYSVAGGSNIIMVLRSVITASSIFFFAFVMLTEPLTTPPTKFLQIIYGVLTGIMFAPQFHIGNFYTTPEMALVLGNIFAYLVSPKYKIITTIKEKVQTAPDMIDFLFRPKNIPVFSPGQYMEWTLPHRGTDSRGNRRYFTIASSPTEEFMRLGVKFYSNGSSYKNALKNADESTVVVGAQPAGDFTLPENTQKKMVFIAGGIGITPFRSMIKYLIDKKETRQIILFYANKTAEEIAYRDVLDQAQNELGIKTIYTLTGQTQIPWNWQGKTGRIDAEMISFEVPDFKERLFYLSGPHSMVSAFEETLQKMGIAKKQIKTDFFPGFV